MAIFKNGIVNFNKINTTKVPKHYKVKYRDTVELPKPPKAKVPVVSAQDIPKPKEV